MKRRGFLKISALFATTALLPICLGASQREDNSWVLSTAENLHKHIGGFMVCYQGEKIIVRILSVDYKEGIIHFAQVTGSDSGYTCKATFDQNAVDVRIYKSAKAVMRDTSHKLNAGDARKVLKR